MFISKSTTHPECRRIPFAILLALFELAAWSNPAQAQSAVDRAQTAIEAAYSPAPIVPAETPIAAEPELPEAPAPAIEATDGHTEESSSLSANLDFVTPVDESPGFAVSPAMSGRVPLNQCPYDTTHARECRVHWRQLIISSSVFNAFQNGGNLYTSYWYRYETTTGKWFDRWFNSVLGFHWDKWDDGNPFMDEYIGHGIMGAITNYIWIQNDPKGMTVDFANTREYWRSRLRATIFSTAYSFEWKVGPFGEAGVGHNGDHNTDFKNGILGNDTGLVTLVTTPVVGLGWNVAEDYLDKHVVRTIEHKRRNPITLLAVSFITPSRATANILRFRPPWYRDDRKVRSSGFFSEQPGLEDETADSETAASEGTTGKLAAGESGFVQPVRNTGAPPVWPHYGGVHEFGAWWGLSLISGHIWGYSGGVKYMPVVVNYSYLLIPGEKWNLRYSPEVTALAMLDQATPGAKPSGPNDQHLRQRIYGSGLSPLGFRASFFPESRVQPYLSTNGGFVYFADRVLSPQGSQFQYIIDFGCGLTIYRKQRQAVSIGYRYQHISNANISLHNPGTDANTFYVAVSRFQTKGYR